MIMTVQCVTIKPDKWHQESFVGRFGIVFSLSQPLIINVGGQNISCKMNEYMLFAEGEQPTFRCKAPEAPAELLVMKVSRLYLQESGREGDDLCHCFDHPLLNQYRLVDGQHTTNLLLRELLSRLAQEESHVFAMASYRHSIGVMVCILAGRAFLSRMRIVPSRGQHAFSLNDLYYYIKNHITEELSLDQLSEALFFNKYYIAHKFKQEVGISLHQFILQKKLAYAQTLILEGLPVLEVYKTCGFGSYAHFIRAYKKMYGITPKKQFRNSQQDVLKTAIFDDFLQSEKRD